MVCGMVSLVGLLIILLYFRLGMAVPIFQKLDDL